MDKFISFRFKLLLRRLNIAEHYDFFDSFIIAGLLTTAGTIAMTSDVFNLLRTAFGREDALYKQSQASAQTAKIAYLHEKRIALYLHFWHCVNMTKYYDNPAMTQATKTLLFLKNNYKNLPGASYQDASGIMTNFLEDCEKSEWKPSIETLNLMDTVDMTKAANDAFKSLYMERSIDKVTVVEMGKLGEIRREVDMAFEALVETLNVAWRSNEMGAQDESLRDQLLDARLNINSAIHQAQLNLSHRKHHKKEKKEETDGKKDVASQTDSASKPAPAHDKASS
ncbi:MAG: DUF6261 family protein [Tannerellaceae bacterium]|jgi:hypothetical protein|nr:DUF6261 family protein [Tannerellaceae bacterium]